ncbi:MAG: hypothetical protein Fur0025_48340 [Oscillatoriaceae cyanobacterium]
MKLHQYIAAVKEKLAGSPIISVVEISDERVLLDRGYFRARLTLINSDFLEIAESFTMQDNPEINVEPGQSRNILEFIDFMESEFRQTINIHLI